MNMELMGDMINVVGGVTDVLWHASKGPCDEDRFSSIVIRLGNRKNTPSFVINLTSLYILLPHSFLECLEKCHTTIYCFPLISTMLFQLITLFASVYEIERTYSKSPTLGIIRTLLIMRSYFNLPLINHLTHINSNSDFSLIFLTF